MRLMGTGVHSMLLADVSFRYWFDGAMILSSALVDHADTLSPWQPGTKKKLAGVSLSAH